MHIPLQNWYSSTAIISIQSAFVDGIVCKVTSSQCALR